MNIVIMGSGAIGGYYGAKLAAAGENVTFIARGAQLEALRQKGLKLIRDDEEIVLPSVKATDDPREAGQADLILFTTKAYGLEEAAQSLKPIVGRGTLVLPLLNGADIAERVGEVLGNGPMLAGITYIPATRVEPGVIRQHGPEARLVFGEPQGGVSPRLRELDEYFKKVGIVAEMVEDIRPEIWSKFMVINAAAGVLSLTRSTYGAVLNDPDTRALFEGVVLETEAVARAMGIPFAESMIEEVMGRVNNIPPETSNSMREDLMQGRPMELDAITGTTVRLGAEKGVPTPLSRMVYAALKLHKDGN